MANNVNVRRGALHDTIDILGLLRQPDGIHLAADPGDLAAVLASVCVGIRPENTRIGGPFGMSRIGIGDAIDEVIVITHGSGEAEGFGIPMVGVIRSGLESKMRRRIVVPETPRSFIAKIFAFDERRFVAALGTVGPK